MVRDLIQKLDVPRRQVYVEAVILDLTVDKARTIGVSWHQTATNSDNSVNAFVGNQSSTLVSFAPTSLAAAAAGGGIGGGLFAGVLGKSFTLFGQSIPSFGVALQALEHTKDANIISRPHLMTMDNTKATISVGQVIVVPDAVARRAHVGHDDAVGAQYLPAPAGGAGHRSDAAPQRVRFDPPRDQRQHRRSRRRHGDAGRTDDQSAQDPDRRRRARRRDHRARRPHQAEDTQEIDKIPFLGDIPLLGRLFQTRTKQRVKQELLIIMTPYIIRSQADVRRIAEQREEERREFIERFSAFADEGQFDAHVDYKRKRGLLEEVNLTALAAEREADAMRAAERALKPARADGVIALTPAD